MAKTVFRPEEVVVLSDRVVIQPPPKAEVEAETEEEVQEYTGPTAEDLRREAEEFKARWENEKAEMINRAGEEADRIIKEAEKVAFDEVERAKNEASRIKQEAKEETEKIFDDSRKEASRIVEEAEKKREQIESESYKKGYTDGREAGFQEGKEEVERLVQHLHTIINKAIEKRNEIIDESETQLINLVLLIARKVVKVITENQKNVVINNVIQALRKLKTRGDVVIRVNLEDVKLTSEHVKDFMRMVENVKSITVLEDSSVEKGGCIIETDFGEIDARISSQLKEIEERIQELTPIRVKEG
ncbi:MAG: flagellar assembly protein FliH [Spirochaetes bacterium]|nr:MAG: flagellar assembly protein FliH [Spirochaetota bacterium]